MSGIFKKPRTPTIPPIPEPVEKVEKIQEEGEGARRRERKKFRARGRRTTIISGIKSALKKRLGE
jgi:hypothetical protein